MVPLQRCQLWQQRLLRMIGVLPLHLHNLRRDQLGSKRHMALETLILLISIHHLAIKKTGLKRNPNGVPPFPVVPLPYQQPPVQPAFHTIIPSSVPIHGYAFQPCLGPYPSVETPLMKHGSDTSIQPLVPPVNGIHAVNFSDVRPNMQEPGAWHHQRPFNSRDNIHMQQSIGPRAFPRPPYYGPMPGFMGRPGLPGPPTMYYMPAPPGTFGGPFPPRFIPYTVKPGPPLLPPETLALRANIVKQIEYYFSDENLQNDHYLLSLMDDQGWVPISTIADFKRVKRMSTDIPFILDALQISNAVEVQGDKNKQVRRFCLMRQHNHLMSMQAGD